MATPNCVNLSAVNSVTVMDAYCCMIDALRQDVGSTRLVAVCDQYFREVRVGDTCNIVGSRNHDGSYIVRSLKKASRYPMDSETVDGRAVERYNGRTIVVLTATMVSQEELYDGQPGGAPVIYLDRSARTILTQKGDLKSYPIDLWANKSEELNTEERAIIEVSDDLFYADNKSFGFWTQIPQVILSGMSWLHTTVDADDEDTPTSYRARALKSESVIFSLDKTATTLSAPATVIVRITNWHARWQHTVIGKSSASGSEGEFAKGSTNLAFLTNLAAYLGSVIPSTVALSVAINVAGDTGFTHLTSNMAELTIRSTRDGEHPIFLVEIIDGTTGLSLIDGLDTSFAKNISVYYQYLDVAYPANTTAYRSTGPASGSYATGRFWRRITDPLIFPNLCFVPGGAFGGHLFGMKTVEVEVVGISASGALNDEYKTIGTIQTLVGGKST